MSLGKKDKKITDSPENPEETQVAPSGEELVLESDETGAATQADKIKKLRAELEKCKEEKQEYLIGWQRCKADSINARKDAIITAEKAGNRARNTLIEDIIPALDSFDMAIASESWAKMDANWRRGMENVRSQLISALSNQGVKIYGNVGDIFNPIVHDAVGETEEGNPGSVTKVLRKGYEMKTQDTEPGSIVRPAQVIVAIQKTNG